ncbi:MAG TPA: hypothetical protein VIG66_05340, partial [Noviherbaspirillum sp.]
GGVVCYALIGYHHPRKPGAVCCPLRLSPATSFSGESGRHAVLSNPSRFFIALPAEFRLWVTCKANNIPKA